MYGCELMGPNSKFYETELEAIRFEYLLSLDKASENVQGLIEMDSSKFRMVGYPELFQEVGEFD